MKVLRTATTYCFAALIGTTALAEPVPNLADRSQDAVKPTPSKEQLLEGLKPADDIAPRLAKIKASIKAIGRPKATRQIQAQLLKGTLKELDLLDQSLLKLREGFANAEASIGYIGGTGSVDRNRASIDRLREALNNRMKEAESGDKLGNFEIQDLMARVSQAETLSSSVKKKKDEASSAVITRIR